MILVDDVCNLAAKQLQRAGCENYVLLAKCPDSNELFMLHNGNKVYNIGACELMKAIIESEITGGRIE